MKVIVTPQDGNLDYVFKDCVAVVDEDGEVWVNDKDMNVVATYPPFSWKRVTVESEDA